MDFICNSGREGLILHTESKGLCVFGKPILPTFPLNRVKWLPLSRELPAVVNETFSHFSSGCSSLHQKNLLRDSAEKNNAKNRKTTATTTTSTTTKGIWCFVYTHVQRH
jgi:hypothetical protein